MHALDPCSHALVSSLSNFSASSWFGLLFSVSLLSRLNTLLEVRCSCASFRYVVTALGSLLEKDLPAGSYGDSFALPKRNFSPISK